MEGLSRRLKDCSGKRKWTTFRFTAQPRVVLLFALNVPTLPDPATAPHTRNPEIQCESPVELWGSLVKYIRQRRSPVNPANGLH